MNAPAYHAQTDRTLVPVFTEFLMLLGLPRPPMVAELIAAEKLMQMPELSLAGVVEFTRAFKRDAAVRSTTGQNMYEGDYDAMDGGPGLLKEADKLVRLASRPNERVTPWHVHMRWMRLLPLTDGNLIAGLGIWLWMRRRTGTVAASDFLREFYHQTVEAQRA